MENTDLYDTMTHLAAEIRIASSNESDLQKEINMLNVVQKNIEARITGEICSEKESIQVPDKATGGVSFKDVVRFSNKESRDAELMVRLGSHVQYNQNAASIQRATEERDRLTQEITQKDRLFKAALSQNQREAKSVTILSQKTVVVRELPE